MHYYKPKNGPQISNIYLLEYSIGDVYKDVILQGVGGNDVKVLSPFVATASHPVDTVTIIMSNTNILEHFKN